MISCVTHNTPFGKKNRSVKRWCAVRGPGIKERGGLRVSPWGREGRKSTVSYQKLRNLVGDDEQLRHRFHLIQTLFLNLGERSDHAQKILSMAVGVELILICTYRLLLYASYPSPPIHVLKQTLKSTHAIIVLSCKTYTSFHFSRTKIVPLRDKECNSTLPL